MAWMRLHLNPPAPAASARPGSLGTHCASRSVGCSLCGQDRANWRSFEYIAVRSDFDLLGRAQVIRAVLRPGSECSVPRCGGRQQSGLLDRICSGRQRMNQGRCGKLPPIPATLQCADALATSHRCPSRPRPFPVSRRLIPRIRHAPDNQLRRKSAGAPLGRSERWRDGRAFTRRSGGGRRPDAVQR